MAEGNIVNVTEASFEADVLKSATPVLLDFWAEWCGPCKMLMPVLNELATEYAGKVKIAKANVDQCQQLAAQPQFNVQSIPALFTIKNGKVLGQLPNLRSKKDLKSALDELLAA